MRALPLLLVLVAVVVSAGLPGFADDAPGKYWVYFGTYTRGDSEGVYVASFDTRTGELGEPTLAGEAVNPSFVAIHPNGRFLYAVGEISEFEGQKTGGVTAFSIDRATGKLTKLNAQSSGGAGPCHVICDGENVLVANYGGGSVAALPVQEDGSLGKATSFVQHTGSSVNPRRQEGPHAHSINLDAAGKHAVVADLGLDQLLVYEYDADAGTLTANDPPSLASPPGSGPRHFAFHPNGRFAYANLEISLEVLAMTYDAETGTFTKVGIHSTWPEGDTREGGSTAETRVHPNGRFVYVSNRGNDSIAAFRVNEKTGDLTPIGHTSTGGKTPRNFNLSPDGKWILAANQSSSNVVVLGVDPETGQLKPTGREVSVGNPVCIRFLAAE